MSKATRVVVDGVSYPLDDTTAVDFSEAQSLSAAEKQQACTNIGLGNVDDTSDANKPISIAQQTALNAKLDTANVYNGLDKTAAGYALDARQGKTLNDKINATQSDIAIIIEGNQTTHTGGVAVGEYVIVRNSTISGIAEGLYKAAQAIPANTAIDSTYLEAVSGGGLNALNNHLTKIGNIGTNIQNNFSTTFKATEAGTYLIIVRAAPLSGSSAIQCTIKVNNNKIATQLCPAGVPISMTCCASLLANDVVSLDPSGSMAATDTDYRTAWQVVRIG